MPPLYYRKLAKHAFPSLEPTLGLELFLGLKLFSGLEPAPGPKLAFTNVLLRQPIEIYIKLARDQKLKAIASKNNANKLLKS